MPQRPALSWRMALAFIAALCSSCHPARETRQLAGQVSAPPYPPSPVIESLRIDAERLSIGNGDNWPVTWADDDYLYTVYCDADGFGGGSGDGSMGQARVAGRPPLIAGENIYSPTGHTVGGGSSGRKASGMLMVNGVLYMWIRNLTSDGTGSVLAWSFDHAATWTWADWTFPEIGYPVWLNAGQNYADAQDAHVYFYSPNGPSAYLAYDSLLLGRAPADRIAEREAYEFLSGFEEDGNPTWDSDFDRREPAFVNPAGCFRPGVVYNAAIRRYLLTVTAPYDDPVNRYLGVFDAPNPWGPWTTVAYLEQWGAPENRFQPQIPAKWIEPDGLSFYLQYSCFPNGPYRFNAQRASLILR